MKKKIIAVSLITAMVVCNSMTVWAADTWNNQSGSSKYTVGTGGTDDGDRDASTLPDDALTDVNSGQKDVKGSIDLGDATASYNVTISWGALTYSKNKGSASSVWDSGSASYNITGSDSKWNATTSGTTDKITVTNKSNVPIKATFTGAFSTTMAADHNITTTGGAIKIKNTTGEDDTTANTKGTLELGASTSAAGVPGDKFVGVIGTITNVKELKINDIQLGTVTVKIEDNSGDEEE